MNLPILSKTATVTLREVTTSNYRDIVKLAVAPDQQKFVANNAFSLVQAHYHDEAWFRAIYADETPVGFVMLEDATQSQGDEYKARVGLWRLMIDHRYQGLGFAWQTLNQVVAHVKTRPNITELYNSCVPGDEANAGPLAFYQRFGFQLTGIVDDDELELVLQLG